MNNQIQKKSYRNTSNSLPITHILENATISEERMKFCYAVLRETLVSLLNHDHSNFDAHTTANCCHGIALLARDLIGMTAEMNLSGMLEKTEDGMKSGQFDQNWLLAKPLLELCQLYVLNYILDNTISRGIRSVSYKLNNFAKLGYNFSEKLCKTLQKKYANHVALKWEEYAEQLKDIHVSGASVELWGKYISTPHLRTSKNTYFASCMYSSQISLAYLSASKAKIAIVNDIYDDVGQFQTQYVQLLIGDGNGEFYPIQLEEYSNELNEPVVVFGGCAFNNDTNLVISEMEKWLESFPQLMLAGEIYYPQFPKVGNDPEFNNTPIFPEEEDLMNVIELHKSVEGVTIEDPSFYLSNHIFTCSIKQLVNKDNLPTFAELLPVLRERKQLAASQ